MQSTPNSELDLVFISDTTGSMSSYIEAAKRNIETIINQIIQHEQSDVRFALVEYKDHKPQDPDFAFRVTDFTSSINQMKQAVNRMNATGGGDTPESVSCAFHAAVNLEWRENATKVIVWIADAPPHCFMRHGDGFPNGCPCGYDMIQEVRRCVDKDIIIYVVGTEPLQVEYLRTFMRAVAEIANGKYVALSRAELLADLIINGCREEIQVQRIIENVRQELEQQAEFGDMEEEQKEQRIDEEIARKTANVQIDTVVVDNIFEGELDPVPEYFKTVQSLQELKAKMYESADIQVHFQQSFSFHGDYSHDVEVEDGGYLDEDVDYEDGEDFAYFCTRTPMRPPPRMMPMREMAEPTFCQSVSSEKKMVTLAHQERMGTRLKKLYSKKGSK